MKNNIAKIFHTRFLLRVVPFIVLVLVLFKVSLPYLQGGLLRTHDMEFHGARVANYFLALKQGQFPPRWAPNLYYGMGYPVFLFMYPLPYAASTMFFLLGFSVENSINIVMILSIMSGTLGMYLLSLVVSKKRWISLIPALTYLLAPYSLVNMFVRGAFGEVVFFGILPWIFLLIQLKGRLRDSFRLPLFTLALALLFLSHQLSVMLAVPMILGYILFIHPSIKKFAEVKKLLIGFILAGLLVSWFWIPMVLEKKHTDIVHQSSVVEYWKEFPSIKELFIWSKWGYGGFTPGVENEGFSKMIGPHVFFVLAVISVLALRKKKLAQLYWAFFAAGAIFLMLPYSDFLWKIVPIIQYLQFPWRLLWIVVFSTAMLLIHFISSRNSKKLGIIVLVPLIIGLGYSFLFWTHTVGTFTKTEFMWFEYPFSASAFQENLPIWLLELKRAPQDYLTFKSKENVKPEIIDMVRDGTRINYSVSLQNPTEIIHKTAYFPGWKTYVDQKEIEVQYKDEELPGLIKISVPAGEHSIKLQWTNDTWDRKLADALSIFGVVFFFAIYFIYPVILKKKSSRA